MAPPRRLRHLRRCRPVSGTPTTTPPITRPRNRESSRKTMTAFLRRGALLLTSGALGAALSALPMTAAAQDGPVPQAMAEPGGQLTAANFAAVVPVGGTITWTNLGTQAHTVTSSDGAFDSGPV